jgi:hypothetical protein
VRIMPQLVPGEQLSQTNALNSFLRGILNILGPSIWALIVVTVQAGWALVVDALMGPCRSAVVPRPDPAEAAAHGDESQRHRRAARGLELLLADHLTVGLGREQGEPALGPSRLGPDHHRPGLRVLSTACLLTEEVSVAGCAAWSKKRAKGDRACPECRC